jgi:hypothetical protein
MQRMADDWSRVEVEATVAAYLEMLDQELHGIAYNKSEARRRLLGTLNGRSEGAIERKHQNISAILIELGFPAIGGYKPLSNYQGLLYDVVRQRLMDSPALVATVRARAEQPIAEAPSPAAEDLLGRLVPRPEAPERRGGTSTVADGPRPRPMANYLEMEARNRLLGLAGEEFTLRFESERLWRAGQKRLADRIEHVSRTRGDAEGYDVLSFEESGRERLIEVKTTTFGPHTPFFVTRHEVDVSYERAGEYYVYRLFNFRDDPKLFLVPGDISSSFSLQATQFAAYAR